MDTRSTPTVARRQWRLFGNDRSGTETRSGDVMTMVTYSDLIQYSILMVSLIGLCYTVFKGKK